MTKPNPLREGDGKPRVSRRQPGCLSVVKEAGLLLETGDSAFWVVQIAVQTKSHTTITELKMGFKTLLVFAVIIGIAFMAYRVIMKRIDKWGSK